MIAPGFLKVFDVVPGWVYAGALAGLGAFAGYQALTLSSERLERATERLEQAKASLRQIEVAQGETLRLQGIKDEALKRAQARATINAAAAAAAALERDGMRDELDTARQRLPSLSHKACLARADALDTVFRQCAGTLEGMAGKAAGHANDALTFDEAWPSSVISTQ